MKRVFWLGVGLALAWVAQMVARGAGPPASDGCPRPEAGSVAGAPALLRSRNGKLEATFVLRNAGSERFCLLYNGAVQSPTLWVAPGDKVVLRIHNALDRTAILPGAHQHPAGRLRNPCSGASADTSLLRTNLHYHGLNIPPTCHGDDVLGTTIADGATFEYRFQIPANEPPGLYWYHPHPHGLSEPQVLGGASGALVVRGIEQINPAVRGLPEQILILRDLAPKTEASAQGPRLCPDQDGSTRPAKDVSLNYVPVVYGDKRLAQIPLKANQRQFWRVLNAAADTYFDLQLRYDGEPQPLEVVAVDGVPTRKDDLGRAYPVTLRATHVLLPPAGRAEFIVRGPTSPVREAKLLTLAYDSGPDGDCDPERDLARIVVAAKQKLPALPVVGAAERPVRSMRFSRISVVQPVRTRRLYFSENNDKGEFYITEDRPGVEPKLFDPFFSQPNITVQQGSVEDWIVENRSRESHAFHIHQIHFQVLERDGKPTGDATQLRDTVDVPFWDGKATAYPRVKLRMDFRDPEIRGTFVYHCHILEHEDGGMMGTIEVARPNTVGARRP
ncbi:multicopper oxidase family protein [Gloeobacter kilaueensis]|uniref:Multicopper oxidase type 3 n=1 Tax=Gloeobacter kilaueensis (strain ATCC BAA-2537 / CCAP 1431/1 / ULC 316 / JS1) TaxID=1183438 RepID=U5QH62_GLOK1|nr:multicopper oxidase domain-containing protein [Gloeobacter kilaueensis]AGY56954.1 multicopper oxidase type 3 [Gloeobacter kilaueensis JS1]